MLKYDSLIQWHVGSIYDTFSIGHSLRTSDAYTRQYVRRPLLVQEMPCRLLGARPFSESELAYLNQNTIVHVQEWGSHGNLQNIGHFVQTPTSW